MTRFFDSLLRSLAFLSRLPPAARAFRGGPHPLGGDAPAFPVAGLVLALLPALAILALCRLGLAPLPACALAVLSLIALSGALHEDGLGDTADGLFGHRGRDEALRIMKDSRVGTYGALALFGALVLRIALLADIAATSPGAAALALLGAASVSRGWMAWLWSRLPTADPGGLADSVGRPAPGAGWISLGLGGAILGGCALAGPGFGAGFLALFLSALPVLWLGGVLRRRLGGQSGDTLGAAQQLAEIGALLALALSA